MKLSNTLYDILKYLAIIGLPAFEVAIPKLFEIWGIPYGEQIGATCNVIAVLLGSLLVTSTIQYNAEQKRLESIVDYNEEQG